MNLLIAILGMLIRLALSDVSFLQVVVFVELELTLALCTCLEAVRRLIYSLTIASLFQC